MGKQVYIQAPNKLRQLTLDGTETITLNGAVSVTQESDGTLVFTDVPGDAATPNVGDATLVAWPLLDPDGNQITLTSMDYPGYLTKLMEDTAPSLTSDSYVVMGVCSQADVATADGYFHGTVYTASDRSLRGAKMGTGTTTATDNAAQGTTFNVSGATITFRSATDGLFYAVLSPTSMASSNLDTSISVITRFVAVSAAGTQYVFVAVGRTAATAGAVTIKVRAAYGACASFNIEEIV